MINGGLMMKKYFITLLIVLTFLANPEPSKAEVKWDGAQVVKGQTGKMTFTKDVKVYKKNANGTYSSMTVKRNNYFRVYNIEKYDNKTYYWMSSGYRVQATDLVVFKKIPLNIRASLYDNPGYININQGISYSYGRHYLNEYVEGALTNEISIGENLLEIYYGDYGDSESIKRYIDGIDIRIAETTIRDEGFYTLTVSAQGLSGPMKGASLRGEYSKGTVFQSLGIEINGYLMVNSVGTIRKHVYIPVPLLQHTQNQGKRYIRYGVRAWGAEKNLELKHFGVKAWPSGKDLELRRFDEVTLLTEKDSFAWVEVEGETYRVPKEVLATIRPHESPIITTSFLPNDTLLQLEFGTGVYKRSSNNRFEGPNAHQFIDYHETEQTFNYEKDGNIYIFEKPVTEGSRMTMKWRGSEEEEGFVRAIHYTYTTPAGTFNNVVETFLGDLFAPGYGDIGNLRSYE